MTPKPITTVRTGVLDAAFERHGDAGGWPVVLLHGFPYDARCYDHVAPALAAAGANVVVPYLRGYGPTRFIDATTMRSGQQAALASRSSRTHRRTRTDRPDRGRLRLGWPCRLCLVAALWPDRVRGLVTVSGYNVQNIPAAGFLPHRRTVERRLWYQYYLHGDRGRSGVGRTAPRVHPTAVARMVNRVGRFTDAEFAATAASFGQPRLRRRRGAPQPAPLRAGAR